MTWDDLPARVLFYGLAELLHGNDHNGKNGRHRQMRACPGGCGNRTRLRLCLQCETRYKVQNAKQRRA